MVAIDYDVIVFKEDNAYVSYCPELDVSSCGNTVDQAKEGSSAESVVDFWFG